MRLLLLAVAALSLHPAIVGTSKPAESLTPARILATLPRPEQKPWLDYLAASARQQSADKAVLAAERKGLATIPPPPAEGFSARAIPIDATPAFYATPASLAKAQILLTFQLPNGGWSKNLSFTAARLPGQSWMANNLSKYLGPNDFDAPADPAWNYAGTLDNDATNTELHFLARVQAAYPGHEGDPLRAAYLRGVHYLLALPVPQRRLAPGLAARRRLPRRHHLQRQRRHRIRRSSPPNRRGSGRLRLRPRRHSPRGTGRRHPSHRPHPPLPGRN